MNEPQQSKSVCRCAYCKSHYPFILASFDCELNAPVCAACFRLLWVAKEVLKANGMPTCTKDHRK